MVKGKKIIKATSIEDLIDKSLDNKNNNKIIFEIADIKNEIVDIMKQSINIDLSNYKHIIDNYSILHIIKNHGDALKEMKRGQLPVTLDYFKKIYQIVNNPDKVYYDGKNKIGRDIIIYEKKIHNNIIYVEEIRTGKKQLVTNSMRIKKAP